MQHYNLRSANSFIGSSLHDLNTVDSRPNNLDAIGDAVDRHADDSLDADDDSNAAVVSRLFLFLFEKKKRDCIRMFR